MMPLKRLVRINGRTLPESSDPAREIYTSTSDQSEGVGW